MTRGPTRDGAAAAWSILSTRLAESVEAGRLAPCLVDPDPFTSDELEERSEAAAACAGCSARLHCAQFAILSGERDWVWGGVDLTPYGQGRGDAAEGHRRLLEVMGR